MGEMLFVRQCDPVSPAVAVTCCSPFADTVHRQDGAFFERRWEERACSVRFMMLGVDVSLPFLEPKALVYLVRQVELLAQPNWHSLIERPEPLGRISKVGFQ